MSGLEPLQQLENFFDIIIFQFVGCTPSGMEFDFIVIVPLLPSRYSFFDFGRAVSFYGGSSILLSMAVEHAILVFSQETSRCPLNLF